MSSLNSRFTRVLFVLAGLAACLRPASAQISLSIDRTAQTYSWSGTFTGNLTAANSNYHIMVLKAATEFTGTSANFGSDQGGLTFSLSGFANASTNDPMILAPSNMNMVVQLGSILNNPQGTSGTFTLTGDSTTHSYADAPSDVIDYMESLGGTDLSFYAFNADYTVTVGSVSVVPPLTGGSAVPEPSTYAALAGVAALGLAAWRRRRATAA